jgi:hypothetical protein
MGDIDELTCRICLDDVVRENVIAPCRCAGSSKWVHRECLDKWRSMREDRAFAHCTECLAEYSMMSMDDEPAEVKNARHRSYIYHVARDFSGVFMVSQIIIVLVAYIVFFADGGQLLKQAGYGK